MPDAGELILMLVVGGGVAALVATPFVRNRGGRAGVPATLPPSDDLEALAIRHRVALEAIRDVETDHRSGSLNGTAYVDQREAAEQRAAVTLAELDIAHANRDRLMSGEEENADRRAGAPPVRLRIIGLAGALIAVAVLVGLVVPAPLSLANPTQSNQALANQLAQEEARQATIRRLLAQLSGNPRDTETLSQLADAYLQGGTAQDLSKGATVLLTLLGLEPTNASAYQRLITAYINAGDWADASAATESYAEISPSSSDIAFFRGLIALRGRNDRPAAIAQFRAFLAAAPDDPRATMVRALIAEAGSSNPTASPTTP